MLALASAQALSFVQALPDGLDTRIGPDGVALSGGERQRLTIARALLKDAPVLILDEATSATDPSCEAEVQRALTNLIEGRTVIVIAHRLHSITGADCIHVMENGQITASGTHQTLLQKQGIYRQMWSDFEATQDGNQP